MHPQPAKMHRLILLSRAFVYSSTFLGPSPWNSVVEATVTWEYSSSVASSSSLRLRAIFTRTRLGTLRIPWDQRALLSFTSILTSDVFIIFWANLRTSLTALG